MVIYPLPLIQPDKLHHRDEHLLVKHKESIDNWQGQIRGKENWKKAREIALAGTPEALVEAIQLADRVSE